MESLIETFHVDVSLLIAQAINFAIVIAVLYFFAMKPLVKIMQERTKKIEKSLEDAKRIDENLTRTKEDYEKEIVRAKKEASSIIEKAREGAEAKGEEMIDKAREDIGRMMAKSKDEIHKEKIKIVKEVKAEVAGLVVDATEKILEKKMDKKADTIEFNSRARALFRDSKAGSREKVEQAVAFIDQLEADGGTEIRKALELALDGKQKHERIRQVVFLTDGSVSNEEELFTLINNQLGDSRLFTVGIGSAPNSYFMTRAATLGRGSYTFIGKLEEVREKMTNLFAMLEQPAVTNLQLTGVDGFEVLPDPLPDLYQGEPLTVVMKGRGRADKLLLSGMQGGLKPWRAAIDTAAFADRPGIAVLWARKKIKILMDSLASGADAQQVEQKVTELALINHLVSRYTSLVAVEEKISRPGDSDGSNDPDDPNTSLRKQKVKTNLPVGWVHDKVFAGGANTATSAPLFFLIGLFLLSLSAFLFWMQWRRQ